MGSYMPHHSPHPIEANTLVPLHRRGRGHTPVTRAVHTPPSHSSRISWPSLTPTQIPTLHIRLQPPHIPPNIPRRLLLPLPPVRTSSALPLVLMYKVASPYLSTLCCIIAVLYFPVSGGRPALPVPLPAAISLFSLPLFPLRAP
jgi:hypothetical protein